MKRLCAVVISFAAFAFLSTSGRAEAPVIRDATGALRANVVPATEWCSPVVSVDLHATRATFENQSEEVQRFIGAIRASVDYDCPSVEIIRIRAFAAKADVFFAYTSKVTEWNIVVFSDAKNVLPMLSVKRGSAASLRSLADFETRTQLSRANIGAATFEPEGDAQADHVVWTIDGAQGETYALTDRRERFRSLDDFTDAVAHAAVDRCVNERGGSPRNATSGKILPNAQFRSFECAYGQSQTSVAIVVREIANVTAIFVMTSEYKSLLATLTKFMTDKATVY